MVYLVGAGPGDDGLITVKGLDCIKNADVIIYDHLANPSLLSFAKNSCALIYAGKTSGNHHLNQEQINKTIIDCAHKYENVVRLKGGDPFVFGRGGEEAEALFQSGIAYELVAGVSSCYSAAEYCGIPVTHRGKASSFHVITGHEKAGGSDVDYGALANLQGTLVFLMGLSKIADICSALIRNGKRPDTPAAVISNSTLCTQKHIVGTLKNIAEKSQELTSPAVIIIGDVAAHKREWFFPVDKKILATGTRKMNTHIKNAAQGLDITAIELIKTTAINFDLFADTDLESFSHIIFTSETGVNVFFNYMKNLSRDIRTLKNAKFGAIGKNTAAALLKRGIFADIAPDIHSPAELAKQICGSKCERALLVRAQNGSDTIKDILRENNVAFTDLMLYKTETDFSKKELLNLCVGEMDYIIFSSGSAVKAFCETTENKNTAKFISIGNETTKAAQALGIEIYKTAETADAKGIIDCIKNDMEGH